MKPRVMLHDLKAHTAICKSIRRARGYLSDSGGVSCRHDEYCPIERAVCAANEEGLRRSREWLANNRNAIKPTIKNEEMGIL